MKPISFLHNSSVGLSHPAQPHLSNPDIFFEKPERLVAFVQVAKAFEDASITVEEWPALAPPEVLRLVHPETFLVEFKKACAASAMRVQEFGKEFFVGPHSFEAAVAAVGCAIEGVDRVTQGRAAHVVCGCRPPGHHARPSQKHGILRAFNGRYRRSLRAESGTPCLCIRL